MSVEDEEGDEEEEVNEGIAGLSSSRSEVVLELKFERVGEREDDEGERDEEPSGEGRLGTGNDDGRGRVFVSADKGCC